MTSPADKKIVVLPGDGIGVEVIAEAVRVIDWFRTRRGLAISIEHQAYGADAYRRYGSVLPLRPRRRFRPPMRYCSAPPEGQNSMKSRWPRGAKAACFIFGARCSSTRIFVRSSLSRRYTTLLR